MIVPKKSLGQNFLLDKNIIKKIVNILKIKNKTVIEIGPGLGSLTDELLKKKPKKLIVIEKDEKLYESLHKKLGDIMWNYCGMARNKEGLTQALLEIEKLSAFWYHNPASIVEEKIVLLK